MEKILNIDGHQVRLKSTGAFLLRYKSQFGRDALEDIYKIQNTPKQDKAASMEELEIYFNFAWTLAKTADPTIKPPMEWLDEFDTFPIGDILSDINELIFSCLFSSIESKKKWKMRNLLARSPQKN
nr:hypothetical protein [uncultured Aminipila sp.]